MHIKTIYRYNHIYLECIPTSNSKFQQCRKLQLLLHQPNITTDSNLDEFFKTVLSERNKIEKTVYTVILYIKLKVKVAALCMILWDPMDSPWDSLGQNTGVVSSLSLLQGILPTRGSNPDLLHCRQILYQLSHKGRPRMLEWVAYPFSSRSSRPRNWTWVSCISGEFFTNRAIFPYRERCNQVKGNDCQEMRMVFITGERSLRWGRDMWDL